jgi:hypothetical protein
MMGTLDENSPLSARADTVRWPPTLDGGECQQSPTPRSTNGVPWRLPDVCPLL